MAKRKKKKLKKTFKYLMALLGIFLLVNFYFWPKKQELQKVKQEQTAKKIEKENNEKYQQCLKDKEIPEEIKNDLNDLEKNLKDYMAKYNVGFKFEELNYNYSIAYKSDKVFYGASLIKLVDAIYLLDNNVDLNITKKYENVYKVAYSSKMAKRSIGEDISLKDLMEYAISVSDNTAHLMLFDYIGFNNLQNYGKSLGGKVILQGGDKFGNQTADDTMIYLNKAFELINNHQNGDLLKKAMLNEEYNSLNFDEVKFGHKYGSYDQFYHDIGIYFENNPYLISVLTMHDKNRNIVTEISRRVYNIHNTIVTEKETYCHNLIYNKKAE